MLIMLIDVNESGACMNEIFKCVINLIAACRLTSCAVECTANAVYREEAHWIQSLIFMLIIIMSGGGRTSASIACASCSS